MKLVQLRNGREVKGVTWYVAQSIETARSSYSVAKLLDYCNGLSLRLTITDLAMDEPYQVSDMKEVHALLVELMERYDESAESVFRTTGVHYTPPKNGKGSLSITTLLAICDVLHCELGFVETN